MVECRFSLKNALFCIAVLLLVFSSPISIMAAPSAIGLGASRVMILVSALLT